MNKYHQNTTLKSLVTATAALGFITVPLVSAQVNTPSNTQPNTQHNSKDNKQTQPHGNAQQGRPGIQADRTPMQTELTKTFVKGYTVPDQHRTHFTEFPEIDQENVVVRYLNGRAYYVNSNDWKIVQVVDLDTSMKAETEDSVLVEGYVIPEERRTRFIEVPKPEASNNVRYFNNTAYYMDSDFKIVRTVPLSR